MEPLARLGTRLGAALQGTGSEADRLLLLHTVTELIGLLAACAVAAGLGYAVMRRRNLELRFLLPVAAGVFLGLAAAHAAALRLLVVPDPWVAQWTALGAAATLLGGATVLWMVLPDLVRLPGGRDLRRAHAALARENQELRRHNRRLEEGAGWWREALALSGGPVALLSAEGEWLHAGEALAPLLGTAPDGVRGRPPRELFGAALLEAQAPLVEEHAATDAAPPVAWHCTPLRDATGAVCARVIVARPGRVPADAGPGAPPAEPAPRDPPPPHAQEGYEEKLAHRAEQLERGAAQLERLGARIAELAGSDPATGLASSQALAGRLEFAVAHARRHGRRFALLLLAADPVDDLQPDAAPLLGALGSVLRAELRETDLAARCDGERICALLPETGAAEAAGVGDRIRRRLAATPLALGDGRTLHLSCRIGAAEWRPGEGVGEVLGLAAEALRRARGAARGSVAHR